MDRAVRRATALVFVVALLSAACGGSESELAASCELERSELGPFGPDTTLGATMDEATARARMAEAGFEHWIAIHADGNWDAAWAEATTHFGNALHDDLSWIDVSGTIDGLYGERVSHGFTDLRVSRSFQGKLEDTDEPLFIGVSASDPQANFDATCRITSVMVGDQTNPSLIDVAQSPTPAP